jgi:hypothetical protein
MEMSEMKKKKSKINFKKKYENYLENRDITKFCKLPYSPFDSDSEFDEIFSNLNNKLKRVNKLKVKILYSVLLLTSKIRYLIR